MQDSVIDDEALADLAAVVRDFAAPDVARVRDLTAKGLSFDRSVWTKAAELGWIGLAVPEQYGGMGADERAVAVVAEILGAGAYPEPYVSAGVLPAELLTRLAETGCSRSQPILDRVVSGQELLGVAVDPYDLHASREPLSLENVDGASVLSGVVSWVAPAEADVFLVPAVDSSGAGVVVGVRREQEGVDILTHALADGTTSATVTFTGVAVDAEWVLGSGGDVALAVQEAADAACVAVAAELLGVAQRALDITLEFIKLREQFGKPIGSFQVIMHRAVDMYVQMRVARAVLNRALETRRDPNSTPRERQAAASSVKARANLAASTVCRSAVHLHGAIGFTDEYDLGHYVNRMVTLTAWMGGSDDHRARYFDLTDGSGKETSK